MSGRPRKPELTTIVRTAMLEAAATVFGREGYSAATMNDIAAAAGYTAPAFYKYFKGKEALFEALVAHVNAKVEAAVAQVPPDGGKDFAARVEARMRAAFELVDRDHALLAVLHTVRSRARTMPTPRMAKRQLEEERRSQEQLATWLAEAARTERALRMDPNDAALLFTALGLGLYAQWAAEKATGHPGPFAARVPLAVAFFLRGVSGPRAAPKSGKVVATRTVARGRTTR